MDVLHLVCIEFIHRQISKSISQTIQKDSCHLIKKFHPQQKSLIKWLKMHQITACKIGHIDHDEKLDEDVVLQVQANECQEHSAEDEDNVES